MNVALRRVDAATQHSYDDRRMLGFGSTGKTKSSAFISSKYAWLACSQSRLGDDYHAAFDAAIAHLRFETVCAKHTRAVIHAIDQNHRKRRAARSSSRA